MRRGEEKVGRERFRRPECTPGVDDSFLCFSSVDQASLLLPELVRALGELGLSINFDNSKVIGNCLLVGLPAILDSFRKVAQVFLPWLPYVCNGK